MSIFTRIRNHNERGYLAVQILLGTTACAVAGVEFATRDGLAGTYESALGFCLLALLASMAMLHQLRSSLRFRLDQASIAEEENQRRLQSDALTGAMTRRHFLDTLKQSLGSPLKSQEAILMIVDLDHFKQLNDGFGHPFGDTALVYLVEAIRLFFPDCAIGRLGGDEFAVLIMHDDVDEVHERAMRLQDMLRDGKECDGHRVTLSASLGAAIAPTHASLANDLMLLADLALYESKAAGRGRLTVFDSAMLSDKRHRRFIERELRAAIYLSQLELHYQPIVDANGSPCGVEGLVRWRHPVRGIISPGEFVPIAERSSLIDTMGAWVFRRACLDAAQFPGLSISINVSGEQLKRDNLIDGFRRTLGETGCQANRFVLEITETAAMTATPEILARLAVLRDMGFRIALDDFGTGHCGFNYLKTLPIDSIKIDRSYIQSLGHDPVARVFVSALAEIARIQDITIVAEGIETEDELVLARTAGCDRFQGYHIARPALKEQLGSLMRPDEKRHNPDRRIGGVPLRALA